MAKYIVALLSVCAVFSLVGYLSNHKQSAANIRAKLANNIQVGLWATTEKLKIESSSLAQPKVKEATKNHCISDSNLDKVAATSNTLRNGGQCTVLEKSFNDKARTLITHISCSGAKGGKPITVDTFTKLHFIDKKHLTSHGVLKQSFGAQTLKATIDTESHRLGYCN